MLILYATDAYLLFMALWVLFLAILVVLLLRCRRRRRGRSVSVRWVDVVLSAWCLLSVLTAVEFGFAAFVDHSDAFNMTKVSQRWIQRHIDGQRNSLGFRDFEQLQTLPKGTRRICFFGDSFTVGHGISDVSQRFTNRIAVRLRESRGDDVVVANMADLGYDLSLSAHTIRAVFERNFDVDTAILVFVPNDIEGFDPSTTAAIDEVKQWQPQFWLLRETYFFNWLYFRCVQRQIPGAYGYFPHLVQSYESPAWQRVERFVTQLQMLCHDQEADFRIVLFPFVHELGPGYRFRTAHQKLRRLCHRLEIPVVDLEPLLSQHAGHDLTVNAFDAHPNALAHQIAADAIEEHLLQDYFETRR